VVSPDQKPPLPTYHTGLQRRFLWCCCWLLLLMSHWLPVSTNPTIGSLTTTPKVFPCWLPQCIRGSHRLRPVPT
jgi:hypothetical protein